MKTLIILCLGLIALLTGACSLIFFAIAALHNSDPSLRVSTTWPFWSFGAAIALLAMFSARAASQIKDSHLTATPERAAKLAMLTGLIACTAFLLGGLAPIMLGIISPPVYADPLVWIMASLVAALAAFMTRAVFALPDVPRQTYDKDPAP